ncbi:MAG: efflux transporter, family, subunit [Phycisphaerales bacterium]|nr:efflux transporter, family, subunit [Phycisphaerales bacterium]
MLTWIKRIVVVVVLLSLVGFGGVWYFGKPAAVPMVFRTTKVTRGDVIASIGANGTVEPDEVIDVGSQVSGPIVQFGTDVAGHVIDYHSDVKAGSLLALIDVTTYAATLDEAKAQLLAAEAGVHRAEADRATAQAKLTQAQSDWQRAEKIGPGDALAQTQYDTYKSLYEQSRAAVLVADASIATAKATVVQAQSAVSRAQKNLDYCTIKSPVEGTVIDRRVNVGQTVVSTQSASSMFLIARDLSHMQVWVAVNEADIGQIHPGQSVTFTCDAFGDRNFKGKVKKIRWNAQMTQNVVIYTVEVAVDNADRTLIPYLTANVQFETARADSTLLIPNGALRWTPTAAEQIIPSEREKYAPKEPEMPADGKGRKPTGGRGEGGRGDGGDSKPAAKPGGKKSGHPDTKPAVIWVKDGEMVRPVTVTTGVTDGASTAVVASDLKEDDEVVTGTVAASAADGPNGPTNPFLPQFRGGRR